MACGRDGRMPCSHQDSQAPSGDDSSDGEAGRSHPGAASNQVPSGDQLVAAPAPKTPSRQRITRKSSDAALPPRPSPSSVWSADEKPDEDGKSNLFGDKLDMYSKSMASGDFVVWKKKFPKQVHQLLGRYSPDGKATSPLVSGRDLYSDLEPDEKADFTEFPSTQQNLEV